MAVGLVVANPVTVGAISVAWGSKNRKKQPVSSQHQGYRAHEKGANTIVSSFAKKAFGGSSGVFSLLFWWVALALIPFNSFGKKELKKSSKGGEAMLFWLFCSWCIGKGGFAKCPKNSLAGFFGPDAPFCI